jgi:tripartite-type tricarboxylate transporter receptor subunit TctC
MRKGLRLRARLFSYVLAAAAVGAAIASAAVAEDYPTRTITDIVASTAGGGTDIISRIFGEQLSKQMG